MKTYFTADWHLGHDKVIQFDKRPFRDMDHMAESLISRFNGVVPEDGVTYILGDFLMGDVGLGAEVLSALNGVKILVVGNHDKSVTAMYNMGFHAVMHGVVLRVAGHYVTLSHYPLKGVFREDTRGMRNREHGENWHGEFRSGHRFEDHGQFHLHGHVHSPNKRVRHTGEGIETATRLGRQYDVGLSGNGFAPVSDTTIKKWIEGHTCRK